MVVSIFKMLLGVKLSHAQVCARTQKVTGFSIPIAGSMTALELLWTKLISIDKRLFRERPPESPQASISTGGGTVSSITPAIARSVQALKSGWLLKRRDLWNGWRGRYFVLYPGRLEYYLGRCGGVRAVGLR